MEKKKKPQAPLPHRSGGANIPQRAPVPLWIKAPAAQLMLCVNNLYQHPSASLPGTFSSLHKVSWFRSACGKHERFPITSSGELLPFNKLCARFRATLQLLITESQSGEISRKKTLSLKVSSLLKVKEVSYCDLVLSRKFGTRAKVG